MSTRELGRTGQRVSALGMGCMSVASDYAHGPSDARKATATLHRAPELSERHVLGRGRRVRLRSQ